MSDAPRYIYIGVGDDGWYVMHPDEKDDADYIYIRADYYEREHEEAERLRSARKIVDQQAEDEGLWFVAEFATEAYLQTALRELHEAVETGRSTPGGER